MDLSGPQGWSGRSQCAEEGEGWRKRGPVDLQNVDDLKLGKVPTWPASVGAHLPSAPPPTSRWRSGTRGRGGYLLQPPMCSDE